MVKAAVHDCKNCDTYAKMVLIILAEHMDAHGIEAWPSVETIAELGSMSRNKAKEAIHALERAGLISYVKEPTQHTSRHYRFNVGNFSNRVDSRCPCSGGTSGTVWTQGVPVDHPGGTSGSDRGYQWYPDPVIDPLLDPLSNIPVFEFENESCSSPLGMNATHSDGNAEPGQKEQPPIPPLSERVPPPPPVVEVGLGGGLAWDWTQPGDWILADKLEAEAHAHGYAFKTKGYDSLDQMAAFRKAAAKLGEQGLAEAITWALTNNIRQKAKIIVSILKIANSKSRRPKVILFDLTRADECALRTTMTEIAVGVGASPPEGWDTAQQRDKYRQSTSRMNGELARVLQAAADKGVNNLGDMVQWVAKCAVNQANGYKGNNAGTVGCGQPVKKGHIEHQMKLMTGPSLREPRLMEMPVWVEDDEGGNNDSNTETTGQR